MSARSTVNKQSTVFLIIEGITIVLLFLTIFFPPIGLIGLLFMALWTKWQKWVKILIAIPILILCFWIISYLFFFRPFEVIGESMLPNYQNGEYILTRVYQGQSPVNRNTVVIFKSPQNNTLYLIKRIVGLPGDVVLIQNGLVYINGMQLQENGYLSSGTKTTISPGDILQNGIPVTVPNGSYFVLGDNRSLSNDSRKFGFVPSTNLIGNVFVCYWNCK